MEKTKCVLRMWSSIKPETWNSRKVEGNPKNVTQVHKRNYRVGK
jgi:hypothetical protein